MKLKVLVTGANGQLAKTIEQKSRQLKQSIDFHFLSKENLDISNVEKLSLFFGKNHFDYCVNCAAYTNVELAETEQETAYKVNAYAVKSLSENCQKFSIALIHISTDYVFDGLKSIPYLEIDQTNPLNIYGKSKLQGELYIKESLDDYFIIRTSWLYSEFGKNFAKTILNKLNADEPLKIITSETGTPTSCNDLAEFIIYLIENRIKKYGIYHFSASGSTTWHGFALKIG
ncbi:MAG: dTDP-4-dehydrorhamnose reductase, partial [Bacteroidota bacterium]